MNFQRMIAALILFFAGGTVWISGQDLVVHLDDGTQESNIISTISNIKVIDGSFVINFVSGTDESFDLSEIQKIDFFNTITGTSNSEINKANNSISIFYNRSDESLYITGNKIAGNAEIYNMNGVKVVETFVESGSNTINISQLSRGIYIVRINNQTLKIIYDVCASGDR